MMSRYATALLWLTYFTGLACANEASARLPKCRAIDTADLQSPGISYGGDESELAIKLRRDRPTIRALFDMPKVQYPFGGRKLYGFYYTFVVGPQGTVTCASIEKGTGGEPVMTPQRRAFLDQVATWRFEPFIVDGKPTSVVQSTSIEEEELPQTHHDMPAGAPGSMIVTLEMRPWWATYSAFRVELHGDGSAIYTPLEDDDALGPQTYHVDPASVQALLARAQSVDFWSLRDAYAPTPGAMGNTSERMVITLGGITKEMSSDGSHVTGLPSSADALRDAVMGVSNFEFWQRPTLATLDQLKINGYDFTSERAGLLLLKLMRHGGVKDEILLALMDLGTPTDAEASTACDCIGETVLEAAFATGRASVATRLIGEGALLSDGQVDPVKVNWAFRQAVRSGRLAAVDLILSYHPDMTYPDPDDPGVNISIIRLLDNRAGEPDERAAVALRLLELGADINAQDSAGDTLLTRSGFDLDYTTFLLDHGANIDVVNQGGYTPLGGAIDEDLALLLLSRGADPGLAETPSQLRFNIKYNHWTRVKTWLIAHGHSDLLKPQKGD